MVHRWCAIHPILILRLKPSTKEGVTFNRTESTYGCLRQHVGETS